MSGDVDLEWVISIHSLHTEGDGVYWKQAIARHRISIHSLHTEGDRRVLEAGYRKTQNFNPLPPHGGRLRILELYLHSSYISIHSLHTEGDRSRYLTMPESKTFQSTPSTRRETRDAVGYCKQQHISIHSLHTEGDCTLRAYHHFPNHFNPLPPHGGRLLQP